jgi:hypothetical protein
MGNLPVPMAHIIYLFQNSFFPFSLHSFHNLDGSISKSAFHELIEIDQSVNQTEEKMIWDTKSCSNYFQG